MSEVSKGEKEVDIFRTFLQELADIKEDGLPDFFEDEGSLRHLFDELLPPIILRHLVSLAEEIPARRILDFYTTVKDCLKLDVLNPCEDDSAVEGHWWSILREVFMTFVTRYEDDPYALHPYGDGIRFKYLKPGALTLTLRGRDLANRVTKSFCQVSGIDGKSMVRQTVEDHIRRCHPIDAEVRLNSLSKFQQLAVINALELERTGSERDLHENTSKTIEEVYWDSVSTLREPSLSLSVQPDFSPDGENLTIHDSRVLARWLNECLRQILENVSSDIQRMSISQHVKDAILSAVLALKRSPILKRLAAYVEESPASKVKDVQDLYRMCVLLAHQPDAPPNLWTRVQPDNAMSRSCAWLRRFHEGRSRPTVEIDAFRAEPGGDNIVFSVSGSLYGGQPLKKFILSVDDLSSGKPHGPTASSNILQYTAISRLTRLDVQSIIKCLQHAKDSVASGDGVQNTDSRRREEFCHTLDRTILAFNEAKSMESGLSPSSPSSSDFTDTTEDLSGTAPPI
jgi:hypothetical protein